MRNQCPDVPIIVLSSVDDAQLAIHTIEEGAQEYLVKGHTNSKVINMAIRSSILRKAAERSLYKKANFDALTGLASKSLFMEHADLLLRKANRRKANMAIMFADVDNFKQVNDAHGHEAGDVVLKTVARRLEETLRTTDLVARYAGDEFLILLDEDGEAVGDAMGMIMHKISQAMQQPVQYNDTQFKITVSLGIATYPYDGGTVTELINAADKAMYQAKKTIGNSYSFVM